MCGRHKRAPPALAATPAAMSPLLRGCSPCGMHAAALRIEDFVVAAIDLFMLRVFFSTRLHFSHVDASQLSNSAPARCSLPPCAHHTSFYLLQALPDLPSLLPTPALQSSMNTAKQFVRNRQAVTWTFLLFPLPLGIYFFGKT